MYRYSFGSNCSCKSKSQEFENAWEKSKSYHHNSKLYEEYLWNMFEYDGELLSHLYLESTNPFSYLRRITEGVYKDYDSTYPKDLHPMWHQNSLKTSKSLACPKDSWGEDFNNAQQNCLPPADKDANLGRLLELGKKLHISEKVMKFFKLPIHAEYWEALCKSCEELLLRKYNNKAVTKPSRWLVAALNRMKEMGKVDDPKLQRLMQLAARLNIDASIMRRLQNPAHEKYWESLCRACEQIVRRKDRYNHVKNPSQWLLRALEQMKVANEMEEAAHPDLARLVELGRRLDINTNTMSYLKHPSQEKYWKALCGSCEDVLLRRSGNSVKNPSHWLAAQLDNMKTAEMEQNKRPQRIQDLVRIEEKDF